MDSGHPFRDPVAPPHYTAKHSLRLSLALFCIFLATGATARRRWLVINLNVHLPICNPLFHLVVEWLLHSSCRTAFTQ